MSKYSRSIKYIQARYKLTRTEAKVYRKEARLTKKSVKLTIESTRKTIIEIQDRKITSVKTKEKLTSIDEREENKIVTIYTKYDTINLEMSFIVPKWATEKDVKDLFKDIIDGLSFNKNLKKELKNNIGNYKIGQMSTAHPVQVNYSMLRNRNFPEAKYAAQSELSRWLR